MKVILYASYVIVALAVIAMLYYGAIAVYQAIVPGITGVWQVLVTVPWYVYAGIVATAAIPVYSVLWCIARDLTEEDWKSDSATLALVLLAVALVLLAVALVLLAIFFAPAFVAVALVLLAVDLVLLAFAADSVDHTTCWYYIFRFPGAAWHHYRRK